MRRCLFALLVLTACQMTACQMIAPGDGAPPGVRPLVGDAIAVTTLDDAPASGTATPAPIQTAEAVLTVTGAGPATPRPKPRPTGIVPTKPAVVIPVEVRKPDATPDATPVVPPSPQQVLCEKSGGQWATAGDTLANLCVRRTKDAGKQCSKKTDCQGQCLARSQTCSPIDPMIGCNDVLEKDGRMVTLCLN